MRSVLLYLLIETYWGNQSAPIRQTIKIEMNKRLLKYFS